MNKVIGFVGLGNMGLPMASNLIEAGYTLRVYNRTAEKAQPLIAQGAELADNPANVVEPDGIAITMLSNDQALEEVVLGENGILHKLGSGGIHLSMSTVSSATANKLAKHHKQRGAHYLAAPVFGRPDAAAARKLWICLSGNGVAKERVLPLLNILGQGVFDFGEEVGAANVVKIAGNFLIISAIEARDSQMPMPLASLLHDRLMASVAKGRGDIDWTGLALNISEEAGIQKHL
jgi:3-hydroxyisobutyrate dehydrogenase-like beta-hydroxyacid dehydrogenase